MKSFFFWGGKYGEIMKTFRRVLYLIWSSYFVDSFVQFRTSMFFKDAIRRQFQMGDSCPFMLLFARKNPLRKEASFCHLHEVYLVVVSNIACFFHCILWEMVQWVLQPPTSNILADLVSTTQDIFPSPTRTTAYILFLYVNLRVPPTQCDIFPKEGLTPWDDYYHTMGFIGFRDSH